MERDFVCTAYLMIGPKRNKFKVAVNHKYNKTKPKFRKVVFKLSFLLGNPVFTLLGKTTEKNLFENDI